METRIYIATFLYANGSVYRYKLPATSIESAEAQCAMLLADDGASLTVELFQS